MNRTQDEMLRIAKVLEKMGYRIVEHYNSAGFLRVYVNGDEMSLWQMVSLSKRG